MMETNTVLLASTSSDQLPVNDLAPIVLFLYNRLVHAKKTIEALQENELATESDLIVFSDAAKKDDDIEKVAAVREYVRSVCGFRSITIVERENNLGLARSIIEGVTSVVNIRGKIIVLEDDMVTSRYFLKYMNDALDLYGNNADVASIHGYVYPISGLPETFFMRGADCWGWATWKEQWRNFEPDGFKLLKMLELEKLTNRFDFNGSYPFTQMLRDQISGKNNSWAIRWHASVFLKKKFTLYPGHSLVQNIGNDGSGTHGGITDRFSSVLANESVELASSIEVREEKAIFHLFEKYFKSQHEGWIDRLCRIVMRVVSKVKR